MNRLRAEKSIRRAITPIAGVPPSTLGSAGSVGMCTRRTACRAKSALRVEQELSTGSDALANRQARLDPVPITHERPECDLARLEMLALCPVRYKNNRASPSANYRAL